MSWDVLFQDLPDGLRSVADIPDDFLPSRPLCGRAELVATIQAVAPDTDVSDPTWLVLDAPGFSIEFSVGAHDPVMSLMLHVRGDDGALAVIRDLVAALGRLPIDCGTGDLLDLSSPGFRKWREYRQRVVRD